MTNMRDVIVHYGVTLGDHPLLVSKKLKDVGVDPTIGANPAHMNTAKSETKEAYMVVAFLSGLNRHRYGPLMN